MGLNATWLLARLSFSFFSLHELSILKPLEGKWLSKQCSWRLGFLKLDGLRHDKAVDMCEKAILQRELVDELETLQVKPYV